MNDIADMDPAEYAGSEPLPPGRIVLPFSSLPREIQLNIARQVCRSSPPRREVPVGPDRHPVAWLPNRAYYEFYWARGIDPDTGERHGPAPKHRRKIDPDLRRRVYERDGYRCLECGATEDLTLDHVVPWSKDGPDTFDNLCTLCRVCNARKGNRR